MKQGFLQALGVFAYIMLISVIFWQAPKIFPNDNSFFGPIAFLLLFSTSALICGVIVFYKPYKLFFAGKKKEAASVVISTAVSLFVFAVFYFLGLILFNR